MELGNVVEFIDSQKIICGVVLDKKKLRLRLLTEQNREAMMSTARLCLKSDRHLDITMGREKLVAALKEIAAHRRTLSQQIDVQSLWEVVQSERQWIDLATMTALCFPNAPTHDHTSATLRAFFGDRLYFRFSPEQFFPHTPQQVEQTINQQELAAQQEHLISQGATWLQHNQKSKTDVAAPAKADTIVEILSSYFLLEKESPHHQVAKAILTKAGVSSPKAIFAFMVNIGVWHPDENLDLLRYEIVDSFPKAVETHAGTLTSHTVQITNDRQDFRDLPLITIDGPYTHDFDDALSITKEQDHLLVGIHITDVGHHIAKGDPVDREAMARASTIYMPDCKIPMLPASLSEELCSLKIGQERPALSTMVRITPDAKILDYQILPSVVCVKQQLTFQDVDAMADDDKAVQALQILAHHYREQRLDQGALSIDLPEINVWLDASGQPNVSMTDRTSVGRMLVAELMILSNDLAARHLSRHSTAAIFRSQEDPRERLFTRDKGTLFQNWMQRKQINRFRLGSTPEPHAGLGLSSYVTATSPIRKYTDLVTQRQLRATAGLETPYTQKEIDFMINALEEPMTQVGRTQYRRNRYWLFKHLESRIGQKEEAMVLFKRRNGYAVLLQNYLLECTLPGTQNINLKPEDLIRVTIQRVSAREDAIDIYFG